MLDSGQMPGRGCWKTQTMLAFARDVFLCDAGHVGSKTLRRHGSGTWFPDQFAWFPNQPFWFPTHGRFLNHGWFPIQPFWLIQSLWLPIFAETIAECLSSGLVAECRKYLAAWLPECRQYLALTSSHARLPTAYTVMMTKGS